MGMENAAFLHEVEVRWYSFSRIWMLLLDFKFFIEKNCKNSKTYPETFHFS